MSTVDGLRDLCCFNYFEITEYEHDKAFPYLEYVYYRCAVCGTRWQDCPYWGDPPPWEADPCAATP